MKKIYYLICFIALSISSSFATTLKEQAEVKIIELEGLISQAEAKDLDTKREELALWVANEFLRFADWDEANTGINEQLFAGFSPYAPDKVQLAADLPDNERTHVIQLLDVAIEEITAVINGTVVRRAGVAPDWYNITQGNDELVSGGRPAFLYDYFSKSFGIEGDNDTVYNDYLGNVDKTLSISSHYVDENMDPVKWRMDNLDRDYDRVGYSLYWHKPLTTWQKNIAEVTEGKAYYFDYDIDNPTMREAWGNIAKNVAEALKGEKVIDLGYCLANEPHWYSEAGYWTQNYGEMNSISSHTLKNFQDWLYEKYEGNTYSLYFSWGVAYESFDDIEWVVPVATSYHGTAQWYDWCRFNMDRVNSYFQMLNDAIHSQDANAKTHIKVMSSTFMSDRHSGIDLESLTEMSGFIGDDAKAKGRNNSQTTPDAWEEHFAYEWKELGMMYDFMESVSSDKIHVNTESHFVSTSHWRDLNMQPTYVRNVYWLATILGMDANLTWFWPRTPSGKPEDRFFDGTYGESSYPGSCAMQPLVVNEYAKVMMDLNAYSEEIMKLRRLKKPLRIFYSETSIINNNDQLKVTAYDLYEKLFFEGSPVGFVTQKIIEKQDNDQWDAIVVYNTQFVTTDEIAALQSYLDKGGNIVIDGGRSLIKDEYGKAQTVYLKESNGKIYNLGTTATADQLATKSLELIEEKPAVEVNEDNGLSQKGCMWRVAEDIDGNYILNIINIGKNTAEISLQMRGGSSPSKVTDMMTGNSLENQFSLDSEGILLVKVEGAPSAIAEYEAQYNIGIIAGNNQVTVTGAINKEMKIYNIAGQLIASQRIMDDREVINIPTGIALVSIEGNPAIKVLIK